MVAIIPSMLEEWKVRVGLLRIGPDAWAFLRELDAAFPPHDSRSSVRVPELAKCRAIRARNRIFIERISTLPGVARIVGAGMMNDVAIVCSGWCDALVVCAYVEMNAHSTGVLEGLSNLLKR